MRKAVYQPGDAKDESQMFPQPDNHIGGPEVNPMDPGSAWCESVTKVDPDHKIAIDLYHALDGKSAS